MAAFFRVLFVVNLSKTSYYYLNDKKGRVFFMDRNEYVKRLMDIGMLKCCAERTVDEFISRDEYTGLEHYISVKECVAEVMG